MATKTPKEPASGEAEPVQLKVIALNDWTAVRPHDLGLTKGDVFAVFSLDKQTGWAEGEKDGKTGWFPFTYVEELSNQKVFQLREKEIADQVPTVLCTLYFFDPLLLAFTRLDINLIR